MCVKVSVECNGVKIFLMMCVVKCDVCVEGEY